MTSTPDVSTECVSAMKAIPGMERNALVSCLFINTRWDNGRNAMVILCTSPRPVKRYQQSVLIIAFCGLWICVVCEVCGMDDIQCRWLFGGKLYEGNCGEIGGKSFRMISKDGEQN